MYLTLRQARAKTDALTAAAKLTLVPHDFELFQALMIYKDATEKKRNDLAHGVFGVSANVPNGIVWSETTTYTTFQAHARPKGVENDYDFGGEQSVYELGDLETIAREIEDLYDQIGAFTGYLHATDEEWRAKRYQQLCNVPPIPEALDRIRQGQKSKT